jgi:hypothetical protein
MRRRQPQCPISLTLGLYEFLRGLSIFSLLPRSQRCLSSLRVEVGIVNANEMHIGLNVLVVIELDL